MRSLDKTTSLIVLLIVLNVVCVTCPSSEENDEYNEDVAVGGEIFVEGEEEEDEYEEGFNPDLERCLQQLHSEYHVGDSLHDFLHGFFKIQFKTHFWDADTNINEMVYDGNEGQKLPKLTSRYFSGLFYSALDVGLPLIPTPREFCSSYTETIKEDCLRDIQAVGCAADLKGTACLEHLYFFWRKPEAPEPLPSTVGISTEDMLEAIYRGCDYFRTLPEERLVNRLSHQLNLYSEISDRQLLADIGFDRDKYFEDSAHPDATIRKEEFMRQYKHYIYDVRFKRYGIGEVSYEHLTEEYIRRYRESKDYVGLYTKSIKEILEENWGGENEEEEEEVRRCLNELHSEFGDGDNVHDLLYGFLKIKFLTHFWNPETEIDEMIYQGKNRLSKLTSRYYFDLFYTAIKAGIKEIPTPRQFCSAYDGYKKEECLREIQAMGCAVNVKGRECLEHLYFYWKKPNEPEPLVEAIGIPTEIMLEAIYRGCDDFRNLSEEQLVNVLSRVHYVFRELSDDQLLTNIGFDRNKYFEESTEEDKDLSNEEYERQHKNYLYEVRFRRYGIGTVSYENLCDEYIRRCKESKASLYARLIYDTLKDSCHTNRLLSRQSFCETQISEKEED